MLQPLYKRTPHPATHHPKPQPGLTPANTLLGLLGFVAFILLGLPVVVLVAQAISMGGLQNIPAPTITFSALWLSLKTSAISLCIMLITGTPLAYILARWQFKGKRLASVFVELPIVMPPAVAGLALLLTFGRRGFVGPLLTEFGLSIPFTEVAVIIAQTFVAMPFFIRAAQVGFATVSHELEDAARVDGANEKLVFLYITLPLASRALMAGLILSWARAIGEFGATILFAGSLQGITQTMPLLVYNVFERDIGAAVWTSLLLIGMAFMALILSQWLTRMDT